MNNNKNLNQDQRVKKTLINLYIHKIKANKVTKQKKRIMKNKKQPRNQ